MLRLRKILEEKLKKCAATAGDSDSSPRRMICANVDRPRDTMEANEDVKPCKICRRPVTTGHECNSQAIKRWLAIKNTRSRRIRNMKRKATKRHLVSRKSRFSTRYRHYVNRNSTVRKRAMYERFTSTKPKGRGTRISSRQANHKYALLNSSKPTVHIRRGIRNTLPHKRVTRKRPTRTSTKQSIQSNQNTSRTPIKKRFARRRCVSSRSIRHRSLSRESQVRAGHRMHAPKRSEILAASKLHGSRKTMTTLGHLPRRSRTCPPSMNI